MNPETDESSWNEAVARLELIRERMAEFEDRVASIPGIKLGGPREEAVEFEEDDFMKSLSNPD